MAKDNNLGDFLTDIANAIRAKKGTSESINAQDFADEIASIKSEEGVSVNRVTYLRRIGEGYIDTGVSGANNNLKIMVRYAMRVFPTGYWRFITAYENESTNTTRIILNKNTQILGNINSVASGGSATLTRTGYTGVIYTETIEPTSDTSFKLSSNGLSTNKTRTSGEPLDKNIHIFPDTTDTIDVELYQCQIYDGDVLVRNFFPCIRGEEFGLWDAVTEKFYGNAGNGSFSGEIVDLEKVELPEPPEFSSVEWTGHADVEGLKAIGWDDDDIAYFQQYGVNWNEEDDDLHKVSDANKAVYGLLTEKNLATYKANIVYLPKIDTSTRTTFASYFINMYWLEGVPYLDTSNATTVSGMYSGCSALLAVPPMNLGKVTSTSKLFSGCRMLRYIPPIDAPKVTDTSSMFQNCSLLQEVPLFDTSLVKNMSSMFNGCILLKEIPEYNTQNVTNMASMLSNCRSITAVPFFDTQNVTNMSSMFYNCYRLNEVPQLNTQNVTTMASMFYGCIDLKGVPQFDTQNVTTMSSMFYNCFRLQNVPALNTPNVTTTASMFYACYSLLEAPQLDMQSVTATNSMFYNCYKLQRVPDMNTPNVTTMVSMFGNCSSLEKAPQMDTKNVTSFMSCFSECNSLIEVPYYDTSKVTTMEAMFSGCGQIMYMPDLNINSSTTFKNMFYLCFSLQKTPIIDTSNATNIDAMFSTATSLTIIPEIDMQNVSKVSSAPFNKCYALKDVKVKNMKVNTTFANCYHLNKESILFMINNEAATSAITITLNSNVYTRYAEDADVLAALAAHPNISLAK